MTLRDINIRHQLQAGDLGYVIHLHGKIYHEEYGFKLGFEKYVIESLLEFMERYDPSRDKVWVCEHQNRMIGFLLGMHRSDYTAQLRYFLIDKPYRGIGLGKQLMHEFMDFLIERHYKQAYLLTTDNLAASAHLYQKFGFQMTEEKPLMEFGPALKLQKYELDLADPYHPADRLA
ncbi:GNAT family N-acetyltransferase [Pararhodonellum marinum]|uniref:GNAT family N-acetyltransferase n=1 Tax=Pararhodonellum marinum TaxID=2755358 RepID=UPI00188E369E|nr:GNAT family N-acetyltransferase [Pararhodonellum marinum]